MKTATLISDKHQRFKLIFKPCKVDLITRHTSTPGVSYGNLSQVLLRDVPRRTPTQGVCGPIGLARSQFLMSILHHHYHHHHHIIKFSAILLKFYRYYSTKHSIRSYTNHQGNPRNLVNKPTTCI